MSSGHARCEHAPDRPLRGAAEPEAALADTAERRPTVAFVAGKSGVGKTRLLTELVRRARDAGALVLVGERVDFGVLVEPG